VTFFHATDSIKSDTLKYSIPAYADILVAYSTYDGMYIDVYVNIGAIEFLFTFLLFVNVGEERYIVSIKKLEV